MWRSGALSVFNDAWGDGLNEDARDSSDKNGAQQAGQGAAGGQISPGGTEYLDLPGEDVFMGTELNEERLAQNSTAFQDARTFALSSESFDFSGLLDQHQGAVSYDTMAGFNMTSDEAPQTRYEQDFDMGPSTQLSFAGSLFYPVNQLQTRIAELPQNNLTDFDDQLVPFDNSPFFQQTYPGPAAPPSPAPTPPPSTSSKPSGPTPHALQTDDQCWQATLARSHAADKSFLYGVTTTKIFCRPSCPSRRATRKHIIFFPFPTAISSAIAAGFRPCKRCKPEALGTADAGILGVIRVLRLIISDASVPFSPSETDTKLETLAEAGGLSAFHFHRLFKATTQLTPGEFIAASRSLALGDALGKDARPAPENLDVTALVAASAKWKPRTARKALGSISPHDYASGAPSLKVERVSIDTPHGKMCVAHSPRGDIFAILLGLDAGDRMQQRFPGATDSEAHAGDLGRCVRELQEAGGDREDDIPEDVKGMLWKARVWVRLVRDGVLGAKT